MSYILLILLLLAIDQATKLIAILFLKGNEKLVLIDKILEFYYTENFGAAFSSFMGQRILLIILTFAILIFFIVLLKNNYHKQEKKIINYSCCFIISGAVGNLIDRIFNGFVVDFIYIKSINFPVFNIADVCIVIGTLIFFVCVGFVKE